MTILKQSNKKPALVLASTSIFRKQILQKLQLDFLTCKPETDETELAGETAYQLVKRLAESKATAGSQLHPGHFVIGSDQVAFHNGEILGKPHTIKNAEKQLAKLSGNRVEFFTGLAVIAPNGQMKSLVEVFTVYFRQLSKSEISAYIQAEMPLNCAGSFKSEALGITLFEKLEGDDPNTLMGLPLIKLCEILRSFDFNPLQQLPVAIK
ncbi:Maf family protein [Catenovulum sediminis]|uniref:7-methyl-GTP pyrophosphatase n=1 Tax=Catenovulum sediminis TaxID=1740262 RepID=A0ABV1RGW5_9ALTE|nr:nucleoside triphosphate pyrophosphatase [Catenovulum sediminis]